MKVAKKIMECLSGQQWHILIYFSYFSGEEQKSIWYHFIVATGLVDSGNLRYAQSKVILLHYRWPTCQNWHHALSDMGMHVSQSGLQCNTTIS